MEHKATLLQLRDLYRFNPRDLAVAAQLELDVIYQVLRGLPVSQEVAEQLLRGLSTLLGQHYSLAEVDVPLLAPHAV